MRGQNLNGFWSDIGNAIGNFGNNWAGGEDQAMYASPNATMANPGGATYGGVQNFNDAVISVLPNPTKTILTVVGLGIILLSLIDSD